MRDFFFFEENWHCLAARAALAHHRRDDYERFCLDYVTMKTRLLCPCFVLLRVANCLQLVDSSLVTILYSHLDSDRQSRRFGPTIHAIRRLL